MKGWGWAGSGGRLGGREPFWSQVVARCTPAVQVKTTESVMRVKQNGCGITLTIHCPRGVGEALWSLGFLIRDAFGCRR